MVQQQYTKKLNRTKENMGNNLLKVLSIKIKIAKMDKERISSDLRFIKGFILNTDRNYFKIEDKKQREQYYKKHLEQFMPTEKQYLQLVGLFHFARHATKLTEQEFSSMLNAQWIEKFGYVREVRKYISNILDKIAIQGPVNIEMEYLREKIKIEKFREQSKALREEERHKLYY